MRVQAARIHAIKAIRVDGNDRGAVRLRAIGKAFNAACLAEEMLNPVLVELVFAETVLAAIERELIAAGKSQNRAQPLAARAVADDRPVEIDIHVEIDRAALATSVIMSDRHQSLPMTSCRKP
eukprot:TRINITY_DN40353_c0_g1_i1.p1 TRINITY_DN40353_c0_g1~~TRINITY_DN40353_c0_g1_i1.p1  ORF type:complete len:123 (-),score=12.09 TRINITY_DN40353_c0_g1_i1:132-500(-)